METLSSLKKVIMRVLTIAWVGTLLAFAVYTLTASRGPVRLSYHLGPDFATDARGTSLTFAVISDTHSHRTPLHETLRSAVERDYDFVVNLGDFVDYDEDVEYRYFLSRVRTFTSSIPLFLVRGNHETMDSNGSFSDRYAQHVSNTDYSFEHKACLFYALDSSSGMVPESQWKRCEDAMRSFRSRHKTAPVFLFAHMPPRLPQLGNVGLTVPSTSTIRALAKDYQVTAIFSGDVHAYREVFMDDTRVIVSGCGGGSFRAPSQETHYIEARVERGQLTFANVPVRRGWSIVDQAIYFFAVAVPRYRWYFFGSAVILLLREAKLGFNKRRRKGGNSLQAS
jgi:hypothetical protein